MSDNNHLEPELSGIPIGHQIRLLRKARGWSLAELADRVGTSAPSLHRYENGWDRFEVATLRRIAVALDAHLEIKLKTTNGTGDALPPGENAMIKLIAPLFWDSDLDPNHLRRYPVWVIGRVLMNGNMAQARAVRRFFGDTALREALTARGVDSRTKTYWSGVLEEKRDAPQSP